VIRATLFPTPLPLVPFFFRVFSRARFSILTPPFPSPIAGLGLPPAPCKPIYFFLLLAAHTGFPPPCGFFWCLFSQFTRQTSFALVDYRSPPPFLTASVSSFAPEVVPSLPPFSFPKVSAFPVFSRGRYHQGTFFLVCVLNP